MLNNNLSKNLLNLKNDFEIFENRINSVHPLSIKIEDFFASPKPILLRPTLNTKGKNHM
jgi:hypothetical protein